MKNNQHEQLFTELTSEEAAVIEGGKTLILDKIKCLKAGADGSLNPDDLFITIDGQKAWGPKSIDDGDVVDLNIRRNFNGSINVDFWDDDPRPDGDDRISGLSISRITNGSIVVFEGSGSKYQLTYKVTA